MPSGSRVVAVLQSLSLSHVWLFATPWTIARQAPLSSIVSLRLPVWPRPIYLDSWASHSRFLCNIVLYNIEPCFHHQSHSQLRVVFVWLHPFIFSGVISPLFSSSIWGTYQPGNFIFQYHSFLPFCTVHRVLKARILNWFAIPFSSGPCLHQ